MPNMVCMQNGTKELCSSILLHVIGWTGLDLAMPQICRNVKVSPAWEQAGQVQLAQVEGDPSQAQ